MADHITAAVEEELVSRAMRVPDYDHLQLKRGVLRTPDEDIPLQRIGAGMFSTAYRERDGDRVFALSDDNVYDKEIAALTRGQLPDNPHVPAVERFGSTADKAVYTMPYYNAPLRKGAAPEAWSHYKDIKQCHSSAKAKFVHERNDQTVDCVRERPVPPMLVEALDGLKDWAANYSSEYGFEFSPRNLASDKAGNLVLLDVLFDTEQVGALMRNRAQERARKQQMRGGW